MTAAKGGRRRSPRGAAARSPAGPVSHSPPRASKEAGEAGGGLLPGGFTDFRSLIERVCDIIAVQDVNGILRYRSPSAERLLGYAPTEFVGADVTQILHPEDVPRAREAIALALRNPEAPGPVLEVRLRHKDGSWRWFDVVGKALGNASGPPAVVINLHDITERREAKEALLESERRLKEAQVLGRIGDWEFDVETQRIEWSDEVYALFDRDPALGPPTPEEEAGYYPPREAERLRRYARRLIEEGGQIEYDLEAELPSGRRAYFLATMSALRDQSGRTVRLAGTVQDITARKQAEKELRMLSARLAETEEIERSRLARDLHDSAGQILTALNLNLTIIHARCASGVVGDAPKRLDECLKLVDQLAEFVENKMSELRPAVLDDYGLFPALRWYAERYSAQTGIPTEAWGAAIAPRLPAAQETALFRIAQEALTNVAKHARASRVTLTLEALEGATRLTVADDGAGFDVAAARKGRERRGWGLTTMHERALAAGGELRIESAPGQGTRVIAVVRKTS
jgi:PAS domain S-box-containing protein